MDDARVEAVGPVVEEDFVVFCFYVWFLGTHELVTSTSLQLLWKVGRIDGHDKE